MEEIIYQKSYQEYKRELDGVLQQTAEGFVRIGYLLKVARDTNILAESGYSSVVEFAQAEYNIDKTQVSRFIHINDKFAENGYSDRLEEKYQGFGYAKLTLMLQLPDEINEELSPDYSKAEIQAIKEEVEEEAKISDLEVMMEAPQAAVDEDNMLDQTFRKLCEDDPELFAKVYKHMTTTMDIDGLKSIMAPAGEKIYSIRVKGVGRIMLSLNDVEKVSLTPLKHPEEKVTITWDDLHDAFFVLISDSMTMEEAYKEITGQDYPVQEPVKEEKPAKKKESRFTKAKTEPEKTKTDTEEPKTEPEKEEIAPVQQLEQVILNDVDSSIPAPDPQEVEEQDAENTENAINTKCEEDIPGQDTIMNHPEYIPEEMTEVIPPENAINTKCETDSEQAAGMDKLTGSDSPAAGMGTRCLTREERFEIWEMIEDKCTDLTDVEMGYARQQARDLEIPMEDLKKAYDAAIAMAAGFEKLIMDKELNNE